MRLKRISPFTKKLRQLREARGKTQPQVAIALTIDQKRYAAWEQGYAEPSIEKLIEIARYYSITVDELILPQIQLLLILPMEEKKKLYEVHLKVYQYYDTAYFPFWVPESMLSGNQLKPGTYQLEMFHNEATAERFFSWVAEHENILKVIGTEKIQ